jgi:glucosamine 6-phosphate synthetase-like amidotransferase/phosphosugar isomerase protein
LTKEDLTIHNTNVKEHLFYSSEFRECNTPRQRNTLVFVVRQSDEMIDMLTPFHEARRRGSTVLRITNVIGSTIAWAKDAGIYQLLPDKLQFYRY